MFFSRSIIIFNPFSTPQQVLAPGLRRIASFPVTCVAGWRAAFGRMSLKGAQNALHGTHAYEPVKGSTQTGYTSMDKNDFFAERDTSSGGPLDGIRVLEATNYASGPVCGMILALSLIHI